jgi:hypothetical protein
MANAVAKENNCKARTVARVGPSRPGATKAPLWRFSLSLSSPRPGPSTRLPMHSILLFDVSLRALTRLARHAPQPDILGCPSLPRRGAPCASFYRWTPRICSRTTGCPRLPSHCLDKAAAELCVVAAVRFRASIARWTARQAVMHLLFSADQPVKRRGYLPQEDISTELRLPDPGSLAQILHEPRSLPCSRRPVARHGLLGNTSTAYSGVVTSSPRQLSCESSSMIGAFLRRSLPRSGNSTTSVFFFQSVV